MCICICVFGSDTDIVLGQDKRSNVFKWILDLSWDWDGRVVRVFSLIQNSLSSDLVSFYQIKYIHCQSFRVFFWMLNISPNIDEICNISGIAATLVWQPGWTMDIDHHPPTPHQVRHKNTNTERANKPNILS